MVDEIRDNKIFLGAFEWRIEFPEVLDEDGRFVGFDCVIGNPPYIQLQKMGADADALQKMSYETYERTGDIYCLFYEMGMKLLKPGALLSFITANNGMRAGYGEPLRKYFSEKQDVISLIDFAGYKVFDSATVDVNILTAVTRTPFGCTNACSINKDEFDITKLSDYVQTHSQTIKFGADAWSILSDIELSIKNKIEAVGTPLKDWNVDIFRGVLTGYNDAFIISSEKREEILANCIDESERQRTAAIIRPILRGRDIKRYGYVFADQYLIATFPAKQYDIDDYPALKDYLLTIGIERLEQTGEEHIVNGERIKARKKTNNKWFETQDSISYWDLLSQPKIVWGEISDKTKFCLDREGKYFPEATTFMLSGERLIMLLAFLNCSVSEYMFSTIGTTTGVGTVRWKKFKIEQLYVPRIIDETIAQAIEVQCEQIINITAQQGSAPEEERILNSLIYRFYGLSDSEIQYIESQVK